MFRAFLLGGLILGLLNFSGQAGEQAVSPAKVIKLFNGTDMTGLYTYLKKTKHEDPQKVFTIHDGMIHASGEDNGYIATDKMYANYHLKVEYKWGKRTDGGKYVRNSGVLLHAVGPDGGAGGVWMSCLECQLAQGCVGDLIVIRGKDAKGEIVPVTQTSDVAVGPDKRPRWSPGGEKRVFTKGQLWWNKHEPFFKELLDTRGKDDVDSPLGEWTKVECICRGSVLTVVVNGHRVNHSYDVFPAAGKILLQTEGHEVYFRNFELHPLAKDEK